MTTQRSVNRKTTQQSVSRSPNKRRSEEVHRGATSFFEPTLLLRRGAEAIEDCFHAFLNMVSVGRAYVRFYICLMCFADFSC